MHGAVHLLAVLGETRFCVLFPAKTNISDTLSDTAHLVGGEHKFQTCPDIFVRTLIPFVAR